jgi:ABC-type sugar transport system ATPase subunit
MLEVRRLIKKQGNFELGPIDFNVGQEVLVVLGENGAGKTTLLNLIAGITEPDEGGIILNGVELNQLSIEDRNIGYIFEKPYLFPHMNVLSNLTYGIRQFDGRSEEKIKKMVSTLNIADLLDREVPSLSGGEQQKVALARALMTEPSILLMDEPLTHLDVMTRRALLQEFRMLLTKIRIPTLYVTHDPKEALNIADRVLILKSGNVVEESEIKHILENPRTDYVRALLGLL